MAAELEDFGHVLRPGACAIVGHAPGLRYRERAAPAHLRGEVACLWSSEVTAAGGHVQRVLPDGCVEIVRQPDGSTLVFGPDASWSDVPPAPGAHYEGIRLLPGAGQAVLGLDLNELTGEVVEAGDLGMSRSRPLGAMVAAGGRPVDTLALAATRLLMKQPSLGVGELARRLSISERHLRRRFERTVGIAPLAFARVARMHAAVRLALTRPTPWTAVAYEAGFADQAHLARELATLTGHSPTSLIPHR